MIDKLSRDRIAALLVFVSALLSLVIVSHHPVLRPSDESTATALAAGVGRIAAPNAAFRGLVLLLLTLQALGLYSFAERLGLSRLWVRAGLNFYGLATILMFTPATLDGFVTPLLGARCGVTPFACRSDLAGALGFEWVLIQAFTKMSLAVQALGLLSWSAALALTSGQGRWAGLAGALVAIAPLAILGTMTRPIDPHGLARVTASEAVWAMGAGAMLWSGRVASTCGRSSPAKPAEDPPRLAGNVA